MIIRLSLKVLQILPLVLSGDNQANKTFQGQTREYLRGKYHCTVDLLLGWFGIVCFANKNKNCHLSYSWFQTSQAGGQWYSDTSPFSILWTNTLTSLPREIIRKFCNIDTRSDAHVDQETQHAACPVLLGQKWSKYRWTNFSRQDETWTEFSTLEVAICVLRIYVFIK